MRMNESPLYVLSCSAVVGSLGPLSPLWSLCSNVMVVSQPTPQSPLSPCCKQSFLPPFTLVKALQIYYVLAKLPAGSHSREHTPGFVVTFCFPLSLGDISMYAVWFKQLA